MSEYDEYELLMLADGRCAQDSYYLSPVSENVIKEKFWDRYEEKIEDVIPLKDNCLLAFFQNGLIKKCSVNQLRGDDRTFKPILAHEDIFQRVSIQTGGYGVCWGENAEIADWELYKTGEEIPLAQSDFISFLSHRVVSTSEAAEMLDCSRQNINDLVARGKLKPVKVEQKNKYFLKSDILQRTW